MTIASPPAHTRTTPGCPADRGGLRRRAARGPCRADPVHRGGLSGRRDLVRARGRDHRCGRRHPGDRASVLGSARRRHHAPAREPRRPAGRIHARRVAGARAARRSCPARRPAGDHGLREPAHRRWRRPGARNAARRSRGSGGDRGRHDARRGRAVRGSRGRRRAGRRLPGRADDPPGTPCGNCRPQRRVPVLRVAGRRDRRALDPGASRRPPRQGGQGRVAGAGRGRLRREPAGARSVEIAKAGGDGVVVASALVDALGPDGRDVQRMARLVRSLREATAIPA